MRLGEEKMVESKSWRIGESVVLFGVARLSTESLTDRIRCILPPGHNYLYMFRGPYPSLTESLAAYWDVDQRSQG
jgi:hypothetical protein